MQATTQQASISTFPLVVKHAGAIPRHGRADGRATANVAILYGQEGKVVVLMVDGNHGASITNCAEELLNFLFGMHLAPHHIDLSDVRWIYRDTEGSWDEILPTATPGLNITSVNFRPLGSRVLPDVWAAIKGEGLSLSDDDKALLGESLGLAPRLN